MAIRKLIFAAIAMWTPLAAQAFEGEQTNLTVQAQSIYDVSVPVEYDVKWKLSTLLGEPTRNLQIRWRLSRWAAMRLTGDAAIDGVPENFLISKLPPEIRDTIRLYDVKVHMGFQGYDAGYDCSSLYAASTPDAYMTLDAGAPAKPGEDWSFNVTGSPDWAKFLTQVTGAPLAEDRAKTVMSQPQLCGHVQGLQVTAKITLGEALRWLRKTYDKKPTRELIAGAERQLENLSDTLDLPVDVPAEEFRRLRLALDAAKTAKPIAEIHDKIKAAAQKLNDGVPAHFIPADKAEEYHSTRQEISLQVAQTLTTLASDESLYDAELAAYDLWHNQKTTVLDAERKNQPQSDRIPSIITTALTRDLIPQTDCNPANWPDYIYPDRDLVTDGWVWTKGHSGDTRSLYKLGNKFVCVFVFSSKALLIKLYSLDGEELDHWLDSSGGALINVDGHQVLDSGGRVVNNNLIRSPGEIETAFIDGSWRLLIPCGINGNMAIVTISDRLEVVKTNSILTEAHPREGPFLSVTGSTVVLSVFEPASVGMLENIVFSFDISGTATKLASDWLTRPVKYDENRFNYNFLVDRFSDNLTLAHAKAEYSSESAVYERGVLKARLNTWRSWIDPNGTIFGYEREQYIYEEDGKPAHLVRLVDGAWQKLDEKYRQASNLMYYEENGETIFVDAMENELMRAKGRFVGANNAFVYVTPVQ